MGSEVSSIPQVLMAGYTGLSGVHFTKLLGLLVSPSDFIRNPRRKPLHDIGNPTFNPIRYNPNIMYHYFDLSGSHPPTLQSNFTNIKINKLYVLT